jgi:cytoskeletal protein CcmA (bactofilin family)
MAMWKRERTERVSLEQAMSEPKKPIVNYGTPPPSAAPAPAPAAPVSTPAAVTPPAASQAPSAESPAGRATPAPAPAPTSSTHSKVSVLGPSIRFKGELIADEDLVIQGQVEGSILHTRSLTIGAQGRVQGDVKARRINVEGTVHGDLYALDGVTLRQGALVTGNVFANKISIAEGARLNGRVDMDKAPTVPNVATRKAGEAATESSTVPPDLSDAEVSAVLHKS